MAGVYDGIEIKLYLEGELVARRPGAVEIQQSTSGLTIGQLTWGPAAFRGEIAAVIVDSMAHDDIWIERAFSREERTMI